MDCSPPGSSVRGIFQTRILEWVAISFSRVSSWPRDWSCAPCIFWIDRQILYHCSTWEAQEDQVNLYNTLSASVRECLFLNNLIVLIHLPLCLFQNGQTAAVLTSTGKILHSSEGAGRVIMEDRMVKVPNFLRLLLLWKGHITVGLMT